MKSYRLIFATVAAGSILCGCGGGHVSKSDSSVSHDSAAYTLREVSDSTLTTDTTAEKRTPPPGYDSARTLSGKPYGAATVGPYHTLIVGECTEMNAKSNRLGLIDLTGREILPREYVWMYPEKDNMIRAIDKRGRTHFFDSKGRELTPPKEDLYYAEDRYFMTATDHNFNRLYDWRGKLRFGISTYHQIKCVSDGLVIVRHPDLQREECVGIRTLKNKVLVEPKYKDILRFSEGLAGVVDKDNRLGFINHSGKLTIPMKYYIDPEEYCGNGEPSNRFSEGLCVVSDKSGLKGYIDRKGRVVIPCTYMWASPFVDGIARVEAVSDASREVYFIDKKGRKVTPRIKPSANITFLSFPKDKFPGTESYKDVLPFNGSDYTLAQYDGKWHLIDATGKVVIRDIAVSALNYRIPG